MAEPNGRFTSIRKVNGGLADFSSGSGVWDGVIVSGSGAQLDQTITLRDGGTLVAKDLTVGIVHELAIAQVSSSAATLGTVYVLKRNG
jgi:hypothetical protein